MIFFFHFFDIESLAKFNPQKKRKIISNLHFGKKIIQIFLNFFVKKWQNFAWKKKKNHWFGPYLALAFA